MGTRALLRHVDALAARLRDATLPPDDPSAVGAGVDLRPWHLRYEREAALTLATVLEGAWLVARVDGSVDRAERRLLAEAVHALTRGGFRADDVDDVLDAAAAALAREGIEARCRAVGMTLARVGAADEGVRLMLAVAAASDGVSVAERVAVRAIAAAAGLGDGALEAFRRETLAELAAPE